ncbi:hypothetical protein TGAM01_v210306 [Trichoderma gamsii]|uniref:Uncharacterized protein n=1 Tax=Trichoderma gamsii TaxID=398673 RepID=A0A2P4Z928_9HYPO|nr:hypothetical protein TGAM01_v210306 [Trichoderma gamsii]PON20798.1 hypothetical protein TGAM01_v210306 [Trichoderma gamsii]
MVVLCCTAPSRSKSTNYHNTHYLQSTTMAKTSYKKKNPQNSSYVLPCSNTHCQPIMTDIHVYSEHYRFIPALRKIQPGLYTYKQQHSKVDSISQTRNPTTSTSTSKNSKLKLQRH